MSISPIDLHSHSNASDGAFTPTELVARAKERGLSHLALTDHDTYLGIAEARAAAGTDLHLIPGIECSTTWMNKSIHIVGLFIDENSEVIQKFAEGQLKLRIEKAEKMGERLEKLGFKDAYERTKANAAPGAIITRGNYARFIYEERRATSIDDAFNTYLKKGKKAYINVIWPDIKDACTAILQAGGIPVLGHPRRYELTNTKLRSLMEYFKVCGGLAIEISSSQQRPTDKDYLTELALRYGFMGSMGSDFHNPTPWLDLGLHLSLPKAVTPVWMCDQAKVYDFPSLEVIE